MNRHAAQLFNLVRLARACQRKVEDYLEIEARGFGDMRLMQLMSVAAKAQDAVIQYLRGRLEK